MQVTTPFGAQSRGVSGSAIALGRHGALDDTTAGSLLPLIKNFLRRVNQISGVLGAHVLHGKERTLTYDECAAAINAGASCFTHTYNGQRGLHHREPGVVGAAMTTPNTYAESICEWKTCKPRCHQGAAAGQGLQHTVLITDCLGYGGMPEGKSPAVAWMSLRRQPLLARRWLCYCRIGAHARAGRQNIVDWGLASADIAIRMATEVPARSAHVEDKCGSIMPGRDADFVVFNPDLTLVETYVGGNSVGNAFTE